MTDPKFVHLRIHSDFSMADGVAKVGKIVGKVDELKMPAMAITDLVNLCGLVKYYRGAHGAGIKPIIGADMWVQSDEFNEEPWRITILCKDNKGYNNLSLLPKPIYGEKFKIKLLSIKHGSLIIVKA